MPIIRSTRLEAESRSGGKFYEVDIFEDFTVDHPSLRFKVNFRFAAIGKTPQTGTKTPNHVSLGGAEVIFQRLIDDKKFGPSRYREVHVVTEAFRRDLRAADERRARSIVCDACEAQVRRLYRPDIFTDAQYEADEPIEDDE